MQVDIDIVVYAAIAGLLLGRLWAVLGTRNEDEPQRPNPFPPPSPTPGAGFQPPAPASRMPPALVPPASLAGGLAQVKAADQEFDEKAFLQNARDVFTSVVGAYAAGNLKMVSDFLAPPLFAQFQQAVTARQTAGQSAQTKIVRMKESEVIAARVDQGTATVTVRIVSDQENIVRDAQGTIIGGTPGKAEEATDIWVFGRDTRNPQAKWIVIETKG